MYSVEYWPDDLVVLKEALGTGGATQDMGAGQDDGGGKELQAHWTLQLPHHGLHAELKHNNSFI